MGRAQRTTSFSTTEKMAHTATLPPPGVRSYADGNPLAIHEQLIEVASGSPEHTREFAEVAARAVGLHYCKHEVCPEVLPHFSTLEEAQEAARHHPGLCVWRPTRPDYRQRDASGRP